MNSLRDIQNQLELIAAFNQLLLIMVEDLFYLDFVDSLENKWFKYTDRTWGNELVRIAKLIDRKNDLFKPILLEMLNRLDDFARRNMAYMKNPPSILDHSVLQNPDYLELILNKYERSLTE